VVYDFKEPLSFAIAARGNIFDKEYACTDHPEPGRNFFVGLPDVIDTRTP